LKGFHPITHILDQGQNTKHNFSLFNWFTLKVGIFTSYERNNGVGGYHIDNIINDILSKSVKE
jgi:hypothetical protein